MNKRKNINARKKQIVLERDEFRCQACGASDDFKALEIDHIVSIVDFPVYCMVKTSLKEKRSKALKDSLKKSRLSNQVRQKKIKEFVKFLFEDLENIKSIQISVCKAERSSKKNNPSNRISGLLFERKDFIKKKKVKK